MRDVTMGQYYPVKSPIHRLDPRIKLMATVIYIVMLFFIPTLSNYLSRGGNFDGYLLLAGAGYAIITLFLLVVILLSRVPLGKVLKSIKAIIYLITFTAVLSLFFYGGGDDVHLIFKWKFLSLSQESIVTATAMALRLIYLVIGPSMLTFTTTPVEITDALEWLLKPLTLIKFPVHTLAMIMSIALRMIPSLMEETDKIKNAQKARCADFESGNLIKRAKALLPILVPLFISAFRRAEDLALAMDSRCYAGAKGRTRMKVLKIRFADIFGFLVVVAVFLSILILRYDWFGVASQILAFIL